MTNTITAAAVALVVLLISVYWRRMAAKQIKDDTKNQAGIKLTESELLAKRRKARRIPSFLMWLAVIILIVIGVYSVWSFFSTRAPKPATGTEASSEAGTAKSETEPTSEPETETAPEEETPVETAENSEEEAQPDTGEAETAEEQIVSEDTALAAVKTMATFSERLGEVLSSPAATQQTTGVLEQTAEEQSEATATPTATPEATAQPTATPQAEAQEVKATLDLSEVNAGLSKLASLCVIADEWTEIDTGVIKINPYFLRREYQKYRLPMMLHTDWYEHDYLQEHVAEYLFGGATSIDMLMYPVFVDWEWMEQAAGTRPVTAEDLKGVDLNDHAKVLSILDKKLPVWEKEYKALSEEEQLLTLDDKEKLAMCNCLAAAQAWYLAFCDSEGIYQCYKSELDEIGRRLEEAFDITGKDREVDAVGREVWMTRLKGVEIFDPDHEEYSATYSDEYFINIAAPLCSIYDGLKNIGFQKPKSYSHWSLIRLGKNSALRQVAHLDYLDDYDAFVKWCPAKTGGIAYKYAINLGDLRPEKLPVTKYERSTPPPKKEQEDKKPEEKKKQQEQSTETVTTTTTSENPGNPGSTPNPSPNPTPTPTPKDGEGAKKSEADPVNQGNANVDGGNQEPGSDKEQDNSKEIENNKNYTPAETAKPTTSPDSSSNSSSNDTVHEGNTEVSKPITETGSSGTATSTTTTENSDGSTTVTEVKKDINSERNDAANENFQGFQ